MMHSKLWTTALAVGFATMSVVVEAIAASPAIMMAQCRARAGEVLRTRLPDIETKYEGQRVDGTHAVNGTAYRGGRAETFQCSFDRAGNRIVRFVVNQPVGAKPDTAQTTPLANVRAEIRTETVRFNPGRSRASIKGKIVGRESVSYILGAEAGQAMTIVLRPSNGATYFNVYQPGKGPGDQALANSGITGPMVPGLNKFSGKLPSSGKYTVSVYMMRSAARRKERSNYTLDISISALGSAAQRPPVQGDYADGLQGGPDYWDVRVVGPSRELDIRAAASPSGRVLGKVPDGAVVRNQGCRMAEGRRWCHVETIKTPQISGWAAGEFLRKAVTLVRRRRAMMPWFPVQTSMRPAIFRAHAALGSRWVHVALVSSVKVRETAR
jgi:hypothetical protein